MKCASLVCVEFIFLIVSLGLCVGFGLEAVLAVPGCFYCWAGLAESLLCPSHLPTLSSCWLG